MGDVLERRGNPSTPEKFWNKVNKGTGCWEWGGLTLSKGYGRLSYQGKNETAHRLAWKLSEGAIPKGKWVLHRCDNPVCCKPWHLFLGNNNKNMKDMSIKHRSRSGNLNDEKVLEIRSRYSLGELQREIAKDYNITRSAITQICSGTSYKYI